MNKLLGLLASLAALVVLAVPASADGQGAFTSTQNMHGPFPPFTVGAACGAPAGTISGSGNAVFHVTALQGGEFWVTTTQEADFLFVPAPPTTLPNFAGHFAVWFGVSVNQANSVTHDIVNVNATATDGSGATLTVHAVDHLSVSASGQVNVFMDCH